MIDVIDKSTGSIVSTSSDTITIECSEEKKNPPLSLSITSDPLSSFIGKEVDFSVVTGGGSGDIKYIWDFGDGTKSNIE